PPTPATPPAERGPVRGGDPVAAIMRRAGPDGQVGPPLLGVAGTTDAPGWGGAEQFTRRPLPVFLSVLDPDHLDVVVEDSHTDTGRIGCSVGSHLELADLPAGSIEPQPGALLVPTGPRRDAYALDHLAEFGAGGQTERLAAADQL